MSASNPSVLISSTYYDLSQVREDLVQFVQEELGYHPLAFERDSFPIDPDLTTIENCRKRVENEADCLVLLVGGRYGYVDVPTGKSVTNLEYLAARTKGIPIYVYLEKQIASYYELWRKTPGNSFDSAVDNPKVFDFIRQIRDEDKVWTGTFERAQDIVRSLRNRFSFLFKMLLDERRRFRLSGSEKALAGLTGNAFRIALEKPKGWEFRLFSQLLSDEIWNHSRLRRDYERAFAIGPGAHVSVTDIAWMLDKMDEVAKASQQLTRLINVDYKEAIGPPGVAGNIGLLCDTASRIADVYRFAMEWTQEIRRAHFHELLRDAQAAMWEFASDFVKKIELLEETFGIAMQDIDEKLAKKEPISVSLNMSLEAVGTEKFSTALEKAKETVEARARRGQQPF